MPVDMPAVEASVNRAPPEVTRRAKATRVKLAGLIDRSNATEHPQFVKRLKSLTLEGDTPSDLDLERIIGTNDLLDLNWFERGLLAARSVCRVILRQGEREIGYGTGFLVAPNTMLTNHHVLESEEVAHDAIAEFGYELDVDGRPKTSSRFTLDPSAFFYTNKELDFTLVAVGHSDGPAIAGLSDFRWLRMIPSTGKVIEGEWMTIVQHPSGRPKQIAARENQLLKIADHTLWYATDTAPGSSGSPVFNDSWQVVALHHSGVPAKDSEGRWLGPDGKPAPSNPSEDQVSWVANEGIRVSEIVKAIEAEAPRKKLRDDFLAAANGQTVPQESKVVALMPGPTIEASTPPTPPRQEIAISETPSTVTLLQRDGFVSLSMPFAALRAIQFDLKAPSFAAMPLVGPEAAEEKFVLDPDYASRSGYESNFLSATVPLPRLSVRAAAQAVAIKSGGQELKYHHFSLFMSAERRLLFFSAENSDRDLLGKQSRKALGDGASDKWIYDTRIDRKYQIGDEFYRGSGFDHGHVVRREDNYWGESNEEAVYSNFDTFHFTNCTPQHPAYNRSSKHGLWGELENYLAEESGAKKPKLSLFAGPIFSSSDIEKDGVLVPKQFWKVVAADRDEGGIATFAFLLSQEDLVRDMEADIVAGPFKTYQLSLVKLEQMTDVIFPEALHKTDTLGAGADRRGADEKLEIPYLEVLRFPTDASNG